MSLAISFQIQCSVLGGDTVGQAVILKHGVPSLISGTSYVSDALFLTSLLNE